MNFCSLFDGLGVGARRKGKREKEMGAEKFAKEEEKRKKEAEKVSPTCFFSFFPSSAILVVG